MLTFKQFCESREKLQEQNPAKGYYLLREQLMPIFTRNYEYYVMDKTDKKMMKVSPEKIVHPDAKEIVKEVPVKNTTVMRSHSKTS